MGGEKKKNIPDDLSIKSFVKNFASEAFHLDSRITRTLNKLFKNPGYLTTVYFASSEKTYLQPLKLYFIINFVFFLLIPVLNTPQFQVFNFNMKSLIGRNKIYQGIIEKGIKSSNVSEEIYEERFNAHLKYNQPAFLFVTIPFFALFLNLVNLRSKRYYLEHLVFSIHYLAFILLYLLLIIFLFRFTTFILNSVSISSGFMGLIFLAAIIVGIILYLFLSVKAFYKSRFMISLLKSFALFGGFILTIFIYVEFLFFYTVLALTFGY